MFVDTAATWLRTLVLHSIINHATICPLQHVQQFETSIKIATPLSSNFSSPFSLWSNSLTYYGVPLNNFNLFYTVYLTMHSITICDVEFTIEHIGNFDWYVF